MLLLFGDLSHHRGRPKVDTPGGAYLSSAQRARTSLRPTCNTLVCTPRHNVCSFCNARTWLTHDPVVCSTPLCGAAACPIPVHFPLTHLVALIDSEYPALAPDELQPRFPNSILPACDILQTRSDHHEEIHFTVLHGAYLTKWETCKPAERLHRNLLNISV